MSGLFGSITIKGNRLTESAAQTASVGGLIPFGFGKFPVEGNVIFAPMPPRETVKKKKQSKGGVKTEEYTYTLSYAIAFCKGPIYAYLTIKRNGKIVWTQDPSATVDDLAYAIKWAQKATFYYGTENQLPDSTIESYKGTGKVSAHRGLAYIVVEDDNVTDNGGAVPTYEAVVVASPPDVYLTSKPYNLVAVEEMGVVSQAKNGAYFSSDIGNLQLNSLSLGGSLRSVLQTYNSYAAESVSVSSTALGGNIFDVLKTYSNYAAEGAGVSSIALNGNLRQTLLLYNNYVPESLLISSIALGGTLT